MRSGGKKVAFALALVAGAVVGLAVLSVIALASTGTLKLYTSPSSAMEPTLRCARPNPGCSARFSDRFAVLTRIRSYDRGDIVVFRTPPVAVEKCGSAGIFVKRIVGLPGETVETRLKSGAAFVYVDGRALDEPYIEADRRDPGPAQRFEVPEDSVFLMGDNRAQSCDSRVFGAVPTENVVGEVSLTYFPPGRISIR
jgi:signal peptidase I